MAGSSLTVFSGYRFVRHAVASGVPVAIVNRGRTRGDDLATVKVDGGCSEILTLLVRRTGGQRALLTSATNWRPRLSTTCHEYGPIIRGSTEHVNGLPGVLFPLDTVNPHAVAMLLKPT